MSPGRDTWNCISMKKHGHVEMFQCLEASSCHSRGQDSAHGVLSAGLPKHPGYPKPLGKAAGIAGSSPVLAVLEISPLDQAGAMDEAGFRHVLSMCLDFGESSGPFQAILPPYPLLAESTSVADQKMQPVRNPPVNNSKGK